MSMLAALKAPARRAAFATAPRTAARSSIRNTDILRELEAEIEHDRQERKKRRIDVKIILPGARSSQRSVAHFSAPCSCLIFLAHPGQAESGKSTTLKSESHPPWHFHTLNFLSPKTFNSHSLLSISEAKNSLGKPSFSSI